MDKSRETSDSMPEPAVAEAWQQVGAGFERFYLTAGVSALRRMMEQDAVELLRSALWPLDGKAAHRWGKTEGKIGMGGWQGVADAAAGASPRLARKWCFRAGKRRSLRGPVGPLGDEPMMLINVSGRRFGRAVRLPEGDIPAAACNGNHREVGGVASVRGVVGGTDEAVDGDRPVEAGMLVIEIDGIPYRKRSGVAGRGRD